MKPAPNAPCPCGSGQKLKRCCRPFHRGAPAPTPEALMRSRYAAYVTGAVDYVIETTDPTGPQHHPDRAAWAREVEAFCRATRFEGLEVLDAPAPEGDRGWVTFRARLTRDGHDVSFAERSEFRRREGRWLYFAGGSA